jgi:hypothetical protein
MPLSPESIATVRLQLEAIARGERPKLVVVGALTTAQLHSVNGHRLEEGLPPIIGEIVFDGRHLYRSRCLNDGYSIDEVLTQLASAFSDSAQIRHGRSTVLANPVPRQDRLGNFVRDEAIFECTARHPRPELYSVVPRGDGNNHTKNKKATVAGGPLKF